MLVAIVLFGNFSKPLNQQLLARMQALSARGRFTAAHQRVHRQHAARGTVRVAAQKKQLMMWEALREATDEEMERDPTVCVMGEHTAAVVHSIGPQLAHQGYQNIVKVVCVPVDTSIVVTATW
jgi:hypothetical protein